jgi:hypothetical protein
MFDHEAARREHLPLLSVTNEGRRLEKIASQRMVGGVVSTRSRSGEVKLLIRERRRVGARPGFRLACLLVWPRILEEGSLGDASPVADA